MSNIKFAAVVGFVFLISMWFFWPKPHYIMTAEERGKVEAYRAEENAYFAAQAKCGRGALSCDKTSDELDNMEILHGRWKLASDQRFKGLDPEAERIIAHAETGQ
jgi:hypothetical protein